MKIHAIKLWPQAAQMGKFFRSERWKVCLLVTTYALLLIACAFIFPPLHKPIDFISGLLVITVAFVIVSLFYDGVP